MGWSGYSYGNNTNGWLLVSYTVHLVFSEQELVVLACTNQAYIYIHVDCNTHITYAQRNGLPSIVKKSILKRKVLSWIWTGRQRIPNRWGDEADFKRFQTTQEFFEASPLGYQPTVNSSMQSKHKLGR